MLGAFRCQHFSPTGHTNYNLSVDFGQPFSDSVDSVKLMTLSGCDQIVWAGLARFANRPIVDVRCREHGHLTTGMFFRSGVHHARTCFTDQKQKKTIASRSFHLLMKGKRQQFQTWRRNDDISSH